MCFIYKILKLFHLYVCMTTDYKVCLFGRHLNAFNILNLMLQNKDAHKQYRTEKQRLKILS